MKIRIYKMLAGTVLCLPALAFSAENGIRFQCPHGARAAVSLAYDDALDAPLDVAIPTLDQYGLTGSFYLQLSNPAVRTRNWYAIWRNTNSNIGPTPSSTS